MSLARCACGCGTVLRTAKYPSQQSTWVRGHRPSPKLEPAAIEARFWARVDKHGPVPAHRPELGPCWIFTGADKGPWGHGRMHVGGRRKAVHRYSWELANGPIPDGLNPLHKCDNGACIRPDHLFLGTQADNMRDMVQKGRQARGDRHGMSRVSLAARRATRGAA